MFTVTVMDLSEEQQSDLLDVVLARYLQAILDLDTLEVLPA